ncbi:keywimysin-related RiPP [Streptomyces sp. NPDC048172]
MRTYERPTLRAVGTFRKVTGKILKSTASPDFLGQHSLLR